jgi:hypothetical protein
MWSVAVELKRGHAEELRYKQGGRTKTATKNRSASGEISFNKLCRCDFKRIGPKRFILWNIVYGTGAAWDLSHERCWFLGGESLAAKGKISSPGQENYWGFQEISVISVRHREEYGLSILMYWIYHYLLSRSQCLRRVRPVRSGIISRRLTDLSPHLFFCWLVKLRVLWWTESYTGCPKTCLSTWNPAVAERTIRFNIYKIS